MILDLRPGSPTRLEHFGARLDAADSRLLYIPEGVFHGYLTLEDDCEVFYQMSAPFAPKQMRGVRWDDAAFDIDWPGEVRVISERDRSYPDYAAKGTP